MVPGHCRQRSLRLRISPQPAARRDRDLDRSRLGLPAALCLSRFRFRARGLSSLLLLPLMVPGIVLGIALYVFHVEAEIATGLPILGSLGGLTPAMC